MQDTRLRRDRGFEPSEQIGLRRRTWKIQARDLDLVPPGALVPRRQHAWIILFGRDHLVARLEIESHLRNLKGLACIARDREFLRICSELRAESPSRRLDIFLDQATVIDGRLIRRIHVSLAGFMHDGRRGTLIAVVQIDQSAIQREGELNLAPVQFVCRGFLRCALGNRRRRSHDFADTGPARRYSRSSRATGDSEKRSSAPHGLPPVGMAAQYHTRPRGVPWTIPIHCTVNADTPRGFDWNGCSTFFERTSTETGIRLVDLSYECSRDGAPHPFEETVCARSARSAPE